MASGWARIVPAHATQPKDKASPWSFETEKKLFEKARAAARAAGKVSALKFFDRHGETWDGETTVLYKACAEEAPESLDAVDLLLQCKASVNATSTWGMTPLHLACHRSDADLVGTLLTAKADPRARNGHGQMPLPRDVPTFREFMLAGICDINFFKLLIGQGQEAVQCLELWLQRAPVAVHSARLWDPLQVILAPSRGKPQPRCEDDYAALRKQNLLVRPETRVDFWYVHGLVAKDAYDVHLLRRLAAANAAVLQTDVISAVVSAGWMQMRSITAWEICCNILTVAGLCCVSLVLEPYTFHVSLSLVAALHAKKSVEVVWQYLLICRVTVDFELVAQLVYLGIGWVAMVRQFLQPDRLEKPWMALFSGMSWLRLVYALRGEAWMGPRVLPMLCALRDTWVFGTVTILSILAATHAFYNFQVRDRDEVYATFIRVIRFGIFGDFDLLEWEQGDPDAGPDYVLSHLLFYCIGVGITILLMNLLVAVLCQNLELYQGQSSSLFQKTRAKMLLELQSRPWKACWRIPLAMISAENRNPILQGGVSEDPRAWALVVSFYPLWILGFYALRNDAILDLFRAVHRHITCCGFMLLWLFSPVFFALSTWLLLLILILRAIFQIQISGLFHTFAVALGYLGDYFNDNAEQCLIWVVRRPEPPAEETRSLRCMMKRQLRNIEEKVVKRFDAQNDRLLRMETKLERLTDLVATQPAPEVPKTEMMAEAVLGKDAEPMLEIVAEGQEDDATETVTEVEEEESAGNAEVVIEVEEPCYDKAEVVTGSHEQLGDAAMEAEPVAEGAGEDIDVSSDADPPILE